MAVSVIPRTPDIYDTLAGLLGETGKGFQAGIQKNLENFFEQRKLEREKSQIQEQVEKLKQQGFSEQEAQLYGLLTTGGQTELAKNVLEKIVREKGQLPGTKTEALTETAFPGEAGLTPAEKVRRREAQAKREFERVKPVLERADERGEQIVQKENALNLMEDAVETGNLGFLSPDNLAEFTGVEGFRTAKGAQFISSGKEYFLGSLKRAGARPNQWIEQQIQKMLPKLGRNREANLTVIEALRSELAVEKEYQNILDRLSKEDEEKYGFIRGNIGQRVRKELQRFGDEEQKLLEQRLRGIQQKGTQENLPKANTLPEGAIVTNEETGEKLIVKNGRYKKL